MWNIPIFVHPTKRSLCYGLGTERDGGDSNPKVGRAVPREPHCGAVRQTPRLGGDASPYLRTQRFVWRCPGRREGAARSAGAEGARRAEGPAQGRYSEPSAGSAARRAFSRLFRSAPFFSVARASRHIHFTCRNRCFLLSTGPNMFWFVKKWGYSTLGNRWSRR